MPLWIRHCESQDPTAYTAFRVSPFYSFEYENTTCVSLPVCLLSSEISKMRTCEQWDNTHIAMSVRSTRIFNFQTSTTESNTLYLLWLSVFGYSVIAIVSVANGSVLRVKWFDSDWPGSGSQRHKRDSLSLQGFQTQISTRPPCHGRGRKNRRKRGRGKDLSCNCSLLQTRTK